MQSPAAPSSSSHCLSPSLLLFRLLRGAPVDPRASRAAAVGVACLVVCLWASFLLSAALLLYFARADCAIASVSVRFTSTHFQRLQTAAGRPERRFHLHPRSPRTTTFLSASLGLPRALPHGALFLVSSSALTTQPRPPLARGGAQASAGRLRRQTSSPWTTSLPPSLTFSVRTL